MDLVRLTFDAIERETVAESAAKDFLDKHAKVTPELFFLGSLKTPKPWSPLLERVIKNFFDLFFSGHNSSILVFSILGQQDEAFLASMVVEYYRVSALNVGKILDICHAANILPHVLQLRYFAFTMDLAVLASQRQLYPLKQFMDDTYKAVGADFVRGVLDFLEMKISVELSSQAGVGVPPLLLLRTPSLSALWPPFYSLCPRAPICLPTDWSSSRCCRPRPSKCTLASSTLARVTTKPFWPTATARTPSLLTLSGR